MSDITGILDCHELPQWMYEHKDLLGNLQHAHDSPSALMFQIIARAHSLELEPPVWMNQ